MATKKLAAAKGAAAATDPWTAPLPTSLVHEPANRVYVFAKRCTNDHGHFDKGDKARGAFSAELVASYVAAGILVEKAGG